MPPPPAGMLDSIWRLECSNGQDRGVLLASRERERRVLPGKPPAPPHPPVGELFSPDVNSVHHARDPLLKVSNASTRSTAATVLQVDCYYDFLPLTEEKMKWEDATRTAQGHPGAWHQDANQARCVGCGGSFPVPHGLSVDVPRSPVRGVRASDLPERTREGCTAIHQCVSQAGLRQTLPPRSPTGLVPVPKSAGNSDV